MAAHPHRLAINVGNSHTVAFLIIRFIRSRVLGLFEHHTNLLSLAKLAMLLEKLISGQLALREVWEGGGHGSLIIEKRKSFLSCDLSTQVTAHIFTAQAILSGAFRQHDPHRLFWLGTGGGHQIPRTPRRD